MAIASAPVRYIQRSRGLNLIRTVAYNTRSQIWDEREGKLWDGSHKLETLMHSEVMLPAGAAERFRDAAVLANEMDAAEKRRDALLGRDFILPLPRELTRDAQLALARSFFAEFFVDKGVPVILTLHSSHAGPAGQKKNDHAHGVPAERYLEVDRFSAKKAALHELEFRTGNGRFVSKGVNWSKVWGEYQERHGISVDAPALIPGKHLGPGHARNPTSEIWKREAARRAVVMQVARRTLARADQPVQSGTRHNKAGGEEMAEAYDNSESRQGGRNQFEISHPSPNAFVERSAELVQSGGARNQTDRDLGSGRQGGRATPFEALRARYNTEHAIAVGARKQAEQQIYDRFADYQQQLRGFHQLQYERQKLEVMRGSERHDKREVLKAERARDRVETQQLRAQQLAAARRDHPLPTWDSFLTREAGRGDQEAARILQQKRAREIQHGHER
jgi:hypothetical protein